MAHVIPRAVAQSHTSVPSRSIARPLYPPPGNTSTAAPALTPFALKIVTVGRVTSQIQVTGRPPFGTLPTSTRSGPETSGRATAASADHSEISSEPEGGCQVPARTLVGFTANVTA